MKKSFYISGLLAVMLLTGCNENEQMVWKNIPGIYLSEYSNEVDTVYHTFTTSVGDIDTVKLDVKLAGRLLDEPRNFHFIVNESSSAVEGLHYQTLAENYVVPAKEAMVTVPIYVLKKGDELDDKIVTLALTLEPDDGLTLAYTDRVHVRILITNQLIRPSYWDMPLSLYFGPYSKAKHQKCIEIMGHDFPLKEEDLMDYNGVSGYSYWMRAGRQVCNYYATHTEYDENGDLIAPWDPF